MEPLPLVSPKAQVLRVLEVLPELLLEPFYLRLVVLLLAWVPRLLSPYRLHSFLKIWNGHRRKRMSIFYARTVTVII
jgi:hypothetical protein